MTAMVRPVRADEFDIADSDDDLPFGHYCPTPWQSFLIRASRFVGAHRGAFRHTATNLIRGNSEPLDVSFFGCNYRLRLENNAVEFGMLLNPRYNADDISFLMDHLPEGGTFLDVGSNIGLFSLPLAMKAGAVLAIDANPLMIERLRWNASASGFSNIKAVHSAVSDHDGVGSLSIRRNDLGQVHLIDDGTTDTVPVRLIKSVVDRNGVGTIDCLKIDIEGHEEKALPPFIESLSGESLPIAIVIERDPVNGEYPLCAAILSQRGYEMVGRTRNNNFYRRVRP